MLEALSWSIRFLIKLWITHVSIAYEFNVIYLFHHWLLDFGWLYQKIYKCLNQKKSYVINLIHAYEEIQPCFEYN